MDARMKLSIALPWKFFYGQAKPEKPEEKEVMREVPTVVADKRAESEDAVESPTGVFVAEITSPGVVVDISFQGQAVAGEDATAESVELPTQ